MAKAKKRFVYEMKRDDLPKADLRKEIGKIQKVSFGHGGYQDAGIGVSFSLGSDKASWGVHDFWGAWAISRSKSQRSI